MTSIQSYKEDQLHSKDRIELIKRTVCHGASDDELQMFVAQCARTGLDPFARQIYSLPMRGGKRQILVSIDGFRLIAERTGKYAGQLGPWWCGDDGEWKDVWLSQKPPVAARIGVIRSDFREPLYAVARFAAYAQQTPTWSKMPDLMIAKVAEALALRRAFPQDLSGLYSSEEMEQATQSPAARVSVDEGHSFDDKMKALTAELIGPDEPTNVNQIHEEMEPSQPATDEHADESKMISELDGVKSMAGYRRWSALYRPTIEAKYPKGTEVREVISAAVKKTLSRLKQE